MMQLVSTPTNPSLICFHCIYNLSITCMISLEGDDGVGVIHNWSHIHYHDHYIWPVILYSHFKYCKYGHPRSSRSRGSASTVGPDGSLSSSLSSSTGNPSHFDPLISQLVSARDSSSSVEGCFCKVLESLNKACTCNLLCYRLHEKRKNSLIEVTKSRTKCGAPNVKGGKS